MGKISIPSVQACFGLLLEVFGLLYGSVRGPQCICQLVADVYALNLKISSSTEPRYVDLSLRNGCICEPVSDLDGTSLTSSVLHNLKASTDPGKEKASQ